jgi:hypothetical protein
LAVHTIANAAGKESFLTIHTLIPSLVLPIEIFGTTCRFFDITHSSGGKINLSCIHTFP